MRIPILLCSLTSLLFGACSKEPEAVIESPTANTAEKPNEEPPIVAKASIASVILSDDCPDEVVQAATAAREIAPASQAARRGPSGDSEDMDIGEVACQQSMMQIAFDGQGDRAANVKIKTVRILSEKGEFLALLKARHPSIWTEDRYGQWNGEISANSSIKTRYKLSIPNWNDLDQKNANRNSMLTLEVELEIGGVLQKLSSKFRRVMAPPEMMIQT